MCEPTLKPLQHIVLNEGDVRAFPTTLYYKHEESAATLSVSRTRNTNPILQITRDKLTMITSSKLLPAVTSFITPR